MLNLGSFGDGIQVVGHGHGVVDSMWCCCLERLKSLLLLLFRVAVGSRGGSRIHVEWLAATCRVLGVGHGLLFT